MNQATKLKLTMCLDGIYSRLLELLNEIKTEQEALSSFNLSQIKSSQFKQNCLQDELSLECARFEKLRASYPVKISALPTLSEKYSTLQNLKKTLLLNINKNKVLAQKNKDSLKGELGQFCLPDKPKRKKFPKFSQNTTPELIDIRR